MTVNTFPSLSSAGAGMIKNEKIDPLTKMQANAKGQLIGARPFAAVNATFVDALF